MQNTTISFIYTFVDVICVTFFDKVLVTFIDALSVTFTISSHTITE